MEHHGEQSLNRVAFSATVHCLTGCAIGEVLGMIIGNALDWGNRETIVLSQAHHRAIANAIADGEGARAEALAREHSRLARTNLETALKERTLTRIPGASLIKFPEAI